jgi:hypothetical protein
MNTSRRRWAAGAAALAAAGAGVTAGTVAVADDGNSRAYTITSRLTGWEEDPLALSTAGSGTFRLRVDPRGQALTYTLRYGGVEGSVTQAHIHLGGRAQSGGISAFLCSNLGNGPAGTPTCPAKRGTVSGTITPSKVVGPAAQGISPGQFSELLAAIRADTTYVNVHTTRYPGGEIRSQLDGGHRH